MTAQAIITGLASVEALIAGLSTGQCFDETPDAVEMELPVVLNIISGIPEIVRSAGQGLRLTTYEILAQMLCAPPGTDLPTGEAVARPYFSKFITKLDRNRTLAGSCADSEVVSAKYGEIKLNAATPGHLGIVFTIRATEEESGVLFSSTST